MSTPPRVTREQVLAYRIRAQGLDRAAVDADDLAVWQLGVQNTPDGSTALSLAARLSGALTAVPSLTDPEAYVSVWGIRGAPLILHRSDVGRFASALWPADSADAVARLAGNGQQLRKAGVDSVEAIRVTAQQMREVVTEAMTKGEISTEVTRRLPADYITWCRGCEANHLGDQLMRLAGLPAGLRLVVGESPATLTPLPEWTGVPRESVGIDELILAYLHLVGPAKRGDVASFFGTTQKPLTRAWPGGLIEVDVDGRLCWLAEEDFDDLTHARPSELVRLLPRSDPWMLARDRELLVPASSRHKILWPMIGHPGVVLVDGEVEAIWRTKSSATRLTVTITAFSRLSASVCAQIEVEVQHVGAQRGARDLAVVFNDA